MTELQLQRVLLESLQQGHGFDHQIEPLQIIETHISWVLLTGNYAYKMKKAVDFGFLDYTTLAKRKAQCEEELRLNHRTAPEIYLDVIPVGGTPAAPIVGGSPAIEYLVKMVQFPQMALLSQMVARHKLNDGHIMALADRVANFHTTIDVAPDGSNYGAPTQVMAPIRENFIQIRERVDEPELLARLQRVEGDAESAFHQLEPLLLARKRDGFIRDCHGDLHLNNILLIDDQPVLFDCIEFNANLRIIDLISEVAFLVMDLEEHGAQLHANLFLNRYLELSGDYRGIPLLRFYLGYRAMVRAKVATIRLDQQGLDAVQQREIHDDLANYLSVAEHYAAQGRPQLIIAHGLSGSGKTTLTTPIMQQIGAIRIRSDVERKRLFGLQPDATSSGVDIYTADASQRTYQQLATLATEIIHAGYPVIVDATFLKRSERDHFRALAEALHLPFAILVFQAHETILRQRIEQRRDTGRDASEADVDVLTLQLEHYLPLDSDELKQAVIINTEAADAANSAIHWLQLFR